MVYPVDDWTLSYARILNENVVLDGLGKIKTDPSSSVAYNNVQGSALFYRSFDFYNLSQLFCKPYSNASAATDLGLPLRTSSNINLSVGRSSLQDAYSQIISDLLKAVTLLPSNPINPMRPSKQAAYGLLSRVYLSQQAYSKAFLYADSCLKLQNGLMDYNQLNVTGSHPIPMFNKEVIFHSTTITYLSFLTTRLIVDPVLYGSYSANDLRAPNFFTNSGANKTYKGSYSGSSLMFCGIATDEMYLNRAECYARAGNVSAALQDLNTLLKTRWRSGTYNDMTAINQDDALSKIFIERRKELCFRTLRWTDLRRLNFETKYQTTLTRLVSGQTYTLLPNSPRYTLPIDNNELTIGGLQQNPR